MSITYASVNSRASDFAIISFLVSPDETRIYSLKKYNTSEKEPVLMVHDRDTGQFMYSINVPLETHGFREKPAMVITPNGEKLYVADIDKSVYIIDLLTNTVKKLKKKPRQDIGSYTSASMVLSPDGKRLYIADGIKQLNSPAVIHCVDTEYDTVIRTIPGKKNGWFGGSMVWNNDATRLYISRVTSNYKGSISMLDTRTNQLTDVAIKIDYNTGNMLIDPYTNKLYVHYRHSGKILVLDAITHKETDSLNIAWDIYAMAFGAQGKKLFLADPNGMISSRILVYDTLTRQTHTIPYKMNEYVEMHTSLDEQRIYVSDNVNNIISVLDVNSGVILQNISLNQF